MVFSSPWCQSESFFLSSVSDAVNGILEGYDATVAKQLKGTERTMLGVTSDTALRAWVGKGGFH